MNGGTVDHGRRSFFSRVLREHVIKRLAETRRDLEDAVRLQEQQRVYESELMAFGPDVLADAARRSGVSAGDADYSHVAKALPRGRTTMPVSAEEHFRIKIGAMIARGFAVDAVRDTLDLKGVSEVWGGPDADDRPAWYVWLNISRGAYRLRLETADARVDGGAPVPRGLLSIRYFPSPDEPAFRHYSERERSLIEGPLFDHTHTPTFHGQARMPESLFHVASMEFVDDVGRGRACLAYSGLDRMRYRYRPAGPGSAAKCRELPSWDLGYPLFDAFVGLHSFLTRTAPKRVILSRQPGFEFLEAEGGGFECREAGDVAFKSLLLACSADSESSASPRENRMCSELLTPPWTPLLDSRARCDHAGDCCAAGQEHGRDRGNGHTLRRLTFGDATWTIPLAFNEQWWRLAMADQVTDTMPCGCH